jgi:hypothetical protein
MQACGAYTRSCVMDRFAFFLSSFENFFSSFYCHCNDVLCYDLYYLRSSINLFSDITPRRMTKNFQFYDLTE